MSRECDERVAITCGDLRTPGSQGAFRNAESAEFPRNLRSQQPCVASRQRGTLTRFHATVAGLCEAGFKNRGQRPQPQNYLSATFPPSRDGEFTPCIESLLPCNSHSAVATHVARLICVPFSCKSFGRASFGE